jgi:hypothetical protein
MICFAFTAWAGACAGLLGLYAEGCGALKKRWPAFPLQPYRF